MTTLSSIVALSETFSLCMSYPVAKLTGKSLFKRVGHF
jgi:hypothetical protein